MSFFVDPGAREAAGSASFSVSARVAMQLGRESISNSIVGILELLKNAYDADAENVSLHFLSLEDEHPLLIIDDDGHGMDEVNLLQNWLLIGTDNKLRTGRSRQKHRVLTGEKGLGRLGLDRLCKTTTLQSFTSDKAYGVELIIDWGKYEDNTDRLETIEHPVNFLRTKRLDDPLTGNPIHKDHGTRLILYDLKDEWSSEAIARLRSELSLLVSPFAGLNDFTIEIYDRGRTEQIGSQEMLEAAEWKLAASVTDTGYVNYRMVSRDGQEFEFSEKWSSIFPSLNRELPRCGPVEFNMYFIPRQTVEGLSLTRSQIDTFMDANQGIRIYRDDFRVKPYGEPSGEGDWLNLAYRRQQHPTSRGGTGWRVGYNQVVGAVFIERDRNDELLDQTNREGIVEGKAFTDLKVFALNAIEWFERNQVVAYRSQNRLKRFEQVKKAADAAKTDTRQATAALESVILDAVSVLDASSTSGESRDLDAVRANLNQAMQAIKDNVERTLEVQEELTQAHEAEEQEYEREKDTLHNLASLGILAVAFGHETLSHSNQLIGNSNLLVRELPPLVLSVLPSQTRLLVEESISNLAFSAKRVHAFGEFMLRNMRRDKRKRTNVYLDRVVKEVLDSFDLWETRNVAVELDFPQQTPSILAFIVDWESIIVNFLTNSLWALGSVADRKIRVRIREQDGQLHLWFADNGQGISKGTIDHIFEPTFTTKRNERGDKIGTGMGLTIVEDLIKSYGGKIDAMSPSDLGGAAFHIQVPIPRTASRGKTNG